MHGKGPTAGSLINIQSANLIRGCVHLVSASGLGLAVEKRMQLLTTHAQVEASLALLSGLGEFATTILKIVIPTNPGAGLASALVPARIEGIPRQRCQVIDDLRICLQRGEDFVQRHCLQSHA